MVRVAVRVSMSVVPVPVAPAGMPAMLRVLPVGWGSVGHIGIPVLPGAGRLTCGGGRCRGDQANDGECREGEATGHYALLVSAPCQSGRRRLKYARVSEPANNEPFIRRSAT